MVTIAECIFKGDSTRWIESVLFERFGLVLLIRKNEVGSITLHLEGRAGSIEFASDLDEFGDGKFNVPFIELDLANEPVSSFLPGPIPAPGLRANNCLFDKIESGYRINYNIIALVYWMLNRVEELDRDDLDSHGRFPAASSHAVKHGYLSRPVVDEWLFILGQFIELQWPGVVLKTQQFSMKVSHDVDMPGRYAFAPFFKLFRRMTGDLLRRDMKGFLRAPFCKLGTRAKISHLDPANTFDWLMDVSERYGIASAFYFICGRTDPALDGDYEIEHPAMRKLLASIHLRGHEIGLHPSYNTYLNLPSLVREAERLRKVCAEEEISQSVWGGRMHYLRWSHPQTLLAWEAAGMQYDSTLGYADVPGFRCGTCFEYPAFNPKEYRVLNIRIRPLVAMEVSIMDEHYLGLGATEDAFLKFKELKDTCRAAKGNFTLLWHNSHFSKAAEFDIYKRVIAC
ncbi:polysaccharide deacetylase family protein [Pseudomonas sp. B16120]|jgi:hypothetical protein|uniref:polysaccharide deacetylase family protein n=1 Tax=Pseudomonas sp. B16120 TaxID=3235108 RepID=UPI0037843B48